MNFVGALRQCTLAEKVYGGGCLLVLERVGKGWVH